MNENLRLQLCSFSKHRKRGCRYQSIMCYYILDNEALESIRVLPLDTLRENKKRQSTT